MRFRPHGSLLRAIPLAPQPLEITPFRLTRPFRLAYTDFIGPEGDFQPRAATEYWHDLSCALSTVSVLVAGGLLGRVAPAKLCRLDAPQR